MAKQNELIEFGVSNLHLFIMKLTQGEWTCEKPDHIDGCINIALESSGEDEPIYADNRVWYVLKNGGKVKAELELMRILDEFKTKYLGAKLDENGGVWDIGNPDDIRVGAIFQTDTDQKANKYVLLNGHFMSGEKIEHHTVEDKPSYTTVKKELEFEGVTIDGKQTCKVKIKPDDTRYADLFTTPFVIPKAFAESLPAAASEAKGA